MDKRYLFTPGPTPVPPQVLAAMAEPMVHHRGSDFRLVYERALSRLQEVYRTRAQVLLFAASGTGAMDSAVANLTTADSARASLQPSDAATWLVRATSANAYTSVHGPVAPCERLLLRAIRFVRQQPKLRQPQPP